MRSCLGVALLLSTAAFAAQSSQPWLVKENPEQLGYVLHLAEDNPCGVHRDAIQEMLDNALLRSRLKKARAPHDLTLVITVACDRRGRMLLYYVAAEFGRLGDDGVWVRFGEQPSFVLQMGDEKGLAGRLEDLIDAALMTYLRTNFDL